MHFSTITEEKAIQYLLDNIPEKTWEDVRKKLTENGFNWLIRQHHGWGLGVRNLLRKGHFGMNALDLDEHWIDLVQKALEKKFGKIDYGKRK